MQPRATTALPPAGDATDPGIPDVEVIGLDPAGTLRYAKAAQRAEHTAAAARIRAACHWADLHRIDGLGAVDPEVRTALLDRHGLPILDSTLGAEGELRLAREGAFRVEEFALTELAAALAMSEPAARSYVGQCLELRDRLPRLHHQTLTGVLPPWKALQIAKETIPLTAAAAAHVDAHLSPYAHRMSWLRIVRAVQAAIDRHDPERAAQRAEAAAQNRGVWVEDRVDGTTMLTAVTDTPHAAVFDTALNDVATTLAQLGDTDPQQLRRAKAIGVLADPQGALDLHTRAGANRRPDSEGTDNGNGDGDGSNSVDSSGSSSSAANTGGRRAADEAKAVIHVHLHTAAVAGTDGFVAVPSAGVEPVARVQGHGPRPTAAITRWLADLAPGARIKVTPVIDQNERISVDAYEAPERLRRQVAERDHTGCCFPWCGRQGRYDVDHITSYVHLEDGGPPGQTNSESIARLCRFHHRVKTHGEWRYQRTPVGNLQWTSPLGWRYEVDEHGTRPLTFINLDA